MFIIRESTIRTSEILYPAFAKDRPAKRISIRAIIDKIRLNQKYPGKSLPTIVPAMSLLNDLKITGVIIKVKIVIPPIHKDRTRLYMTCMVLFII